MDTESISGETTVICNIDDFHLFITLPERLGCLDPVKSRHINIQKQNIKRLSGIKKSSSIGKHLYFIPVFIAMQNHFFDLLTDQFLIVTNRDLDHPPPSFPLVRSL